MGLSRRWSLVRDTLATGLMAAGGRPGPSASQAVILLSTQQNCAATGPHIFFWKKYRWIGLLVGLRFRASVVYKDGVDLKVGPASDKVCQCYV